MPAKSEFILVSNSSILSLPELILLSSAYILGSCMRKTTGEIVDENEKEKRSQLDATFHCTRTRQYTVNKAFLASI
jgi:hypothetical protein